MKLRRILAATAVVIALVAYAQYWISQHPGVKFIGDGNTETAKYISDSRHYRAWPVVIANLAENSVVENAKGIHYSHNLNGIWGVKIDDSKKPLPISNSELRALKKYKYWSPSDSVRSGWISAVYVDQSKLTFGAVFGVYRSADKKFYLIYPKSLVANSSTDGQG